MEQPFSRMRNTDIQNIQDELEQLLVYKLTISSMLVILILYYFANLILVKLNTTTTHPISSH